LFLIQSIICAEIREIHGGVAQEVDFVGILRILIGIP